LAAQYSPQSADLLREKLQSGDRFSPLEYQISGLAVYLQLIAYAVVSLSIVKKYRQNIKEVYSSIENINLSWINFVIFGFIAWKSFSLIETVIWFATGSSSVVFLYIIAEIIFLTFVCIMFLKGLKQPVIFMKGDEKNQLKRNS